MAVLMTSIAKGIRLILQAIGVLLAAPTIEAGRKALDALAKGLPAHCQDCLLQLEACPVEISIPLDLFQMRLVVLDQFALKSIRGLPSNCLRLQLAEGAGMQTPTGSGQPCKLFHGLSVF